MNNSEHQDSLIRTKGPLPDPDGHEAPRLIDCPVSLGRSGRSPARRRAVNAAYNREIFGAGLRFRWTRPALPDLEAIGDFVARDDPTAARAAGRDLSDEPNKCAAVGVGAEGEIAGDVASEQRQFRHIGAVGDGERSAGQACGLGERPRFADAKREAAKVELVAGCESGGVLTVLSGGVVSDGLTSSGGTASIFGDVASGQEIRFVGHGDLAFHDLAAFDATIGDYSSGDEFDLGGFEFGASETRSFTENSGHTGGTLSVTDGSRHANLSLLGSYVTSDFALSGDGHGGTFVKFV